MNEREGRRLGICGYVGLMSKCDVSSMILVGREQNKPTNKEESKRASVAITRTLTGHGQVIDVTVWSVRYVLRSSGRGTPGTVKILLYHIMITFCFRCPFH